jgi:hypothetical protein
VLCRVRKALQRKLEQLASLNQASQAVTASLELNQMLAEIVSLASEVAASDYAGAALVDGEGRLGRSAYQAAREHVRVRASEPIRSKGTAALTRTMN